MRYGCEFLSFTQDADGVTATVQDEGGKTSEISAQYLVGCDGGTSTVRKQLGIALEGEGNMLQLCQALFRCDELFERIPIGKGRHYHVADDQRDAADRAGLDAALHPAFDRRKDEDMSADVREDRRACRCNTRCSTSAMWRQNLLLAERYGEGRVFLAGDAVASGDPDRRARHEHAASATPSTCRGSSPRRSQGWGGPKLLPAYETERRQVGDQQRRGLASCHARAAQVARRL